MFAEIDLAGLKASLILNLLPNRRVPYDVGWSRWGEASTSIATEDLALELVRTATPCSSNVDASEPRGLDLDYACEL